MAPHAWDIFRGCSQRKALTPFAIIHRKRGGHRISLSLDIRVFASVLKSKIAISIEYIQVAPRPFK